MQHSFDIKDAQLYGVNAAIILNNIQHWIKKNQANEKHFYEGHTWTYNSIKAFSKLLPYLTEKQIRTAIEVLMKEGVLIKGNFNKSHYDRTCWYALIEDNTILPEGQIEIPNKSNEFDREGEPIPDINTDINSLSLERKKGTFKEVFLEPEAFYTLLHKKIMAAAKIFPGIDRADLPAYALRISNWSEKNSELKKKSDWWISEVFSWIDKDYQNGELVKAKEQEKQSRNQYDELLKNFET